MADEQAIASSARRPDSERSHTQKAHESAQLKSDRYFLYWPLRATHIRRTEVRQKNNHAADVARPTAGSKVKLAIPKRRTEVQS